MEDRAHETAEAKRLARRAVELGDEDAVALCWGGFSLAFVGDDIDEGIAFVEKGLALNPNLAAGWFASGWLRVYRGDTEEAIDHLTRGMRLNPLDPTLFRLHAGIAYAHFFAGRHEEALKWAEKAVRGRPGWLTAVRVAAACQVLVGQLDEARKLMVRMRESDPALRISTLTEVLPLRRPENFAKLADALRKAGLPE
jgi:tetratricopeptide (TPR) repeat protein